METDIDKLKRRFDSTVKHYNFLLNQKDKVYAEQLRYLENKYKSSRKWIIGDFLIESFIRGVNLLKNPFKFFLDKEYRGSWRGHNSRLTPSSSAAIFDSGILSDLGGVTENKSVNPGETKNSDEENMAKNGRPVIEKMPVSAQASQKLVIAAILGEKSEVLLQPEVTLLLFRPDNWLEVLTGQRPDVLLVESTFWGNRGSWQYKIAKTAGCMGEELSELISWSGENNIPTMFWYTCDPDHVDQFDEKASLFDHILVSRLENIQDFEHKFKRKKILEFPFFIQPKIHNPIDKQIVSTIEPYLPDRIHHNLSDLPKDGGDYYPATYIKAVDFRRIIESMASGIPVITDPSEFLRLNFQNELFFADSGTEIGQYLEMFRGNPSARLNASVRGVRKVLEEYRVSLGLQKIHNLLTRKDSVALLPEICLIVNIDDDFDPELLERKIAFQTTKPGAVVLLSEKKVEPEFIDNVRIHTKNQNIYSFCYYQNQLSLLISEKVTSKYFMFWNLRDEYGPDYLRDYTLATLSMDAPGFGKSCHYIYENSELNLVDSATMYQLTPSVPVNTLMLRRDQLPKFNFLLLLEGDASYDAFLPEILSLDPLNYIRHKSDQPLGEGLVKMIFV